jgi:hypothetical protein
MGRKGVLMTDTYLSPNALILVAIIPSPDDLQVARILGWYRIPFRTAPRILNVDYLAFYQPASFRDRRWQVEFIAPVLGHELVTRGELLREEGDHPRADEEYFKIQLGDLCYLDQPILAGDWKRFTFLYTTGEYFQGAGELTDLTVKASERRRLWKALRERSALEPAYSVSSIDHWGDLALESLSALLGIPPHLG